MQIKVKKKAKKKESIMGRKEGRKIKKKNVKKTREMGRKKERKKGRKIERIKNALQQFYKIRSTWKKEMI